MDYISILDSAEAAKNVAFRTLASSGSPNVQCVRIILGTGTGELELPYGEQSSGSCLPVVLPSTQIVKAQESLTPTVTSGSWTGDSSLTTALATAFRLLNITVHFSTAVDLSSNNLSASLDANDGANYDTILSSSDNSALEDWFAEFGEGAIFQSGDQIKIAASIGAAVAYARIVTKAV